ncbi:hypothetical protein CGLO_12776 [Colletotrichum gloeosporioides Cg-14]|nr:hypothetical protein CGLO_12776 [Colletotrichum gloeosporioides Cg-14]
MILLGP